MLDYYFCEECETYHEPNRLIKGVILSACECSISTQPSIDNSSVQVNMDSAQKQTKFHSPSQTQTDTNTSNQNLLASKIENPIVHLLPSIPSKCQKIHVLRNGNNLSRRTMNNIVVPTQIINQSSHFISPVHARHEVPIYKIKSSASPPARLLRPTLPPRSSVTRIETVRPIQHNVPIQLGFQTYSQEIIPRYEYYEQAPTASPLDTNLNIVSAETLISHLKNSPTVPQAHKYKQQISKSNSIRVEEENQKQKWERVGRREDQVDKIKIEFERVQKSGWDSGKQMQRKIVKLERVSATNKLVLEKQAQGFCTGACFS